ncbi:MAG: right-handed parallel beta-helix repeat-containing protein [Leptolyngbyaceae cyanobacterium]
MVTYYVATTGVDAAERDGLSWETAWRSLAYASDRVPEGNHTIQLGAGTFVATETAYVKSGVTIRGRGSEGTAGTRIVAASNWPLAADPEESGDVLNEYLMVLQNAQDITIQNLALTSEPGHRITGAVYAFGSERITLRDLTVKDFRWVGLQVERSDYVKIHDNYIENASTEHFRINNGLIRTRFIKHSEIYNNTIISTIGRGYGYKGGGHENVQIHHNSFTLDRGFAIESAHENEFGVEISHNFANQTISIPRGRQGADPNNRGYDYTFWIHHNVLTDSYTIEGPRNHLRLSHNYIRIDDTGGNVYTHHGGTSNGPVWIHHNVIENVDRGLVWMNRGVAENIYVYNNTVTLADAGDRAGAILSAPNRDGLSNLNNWVAKNNIFIAPNRQPRRLVQANGTANKMTVTDNITVNVLDVPEGNYADIEPEFRGSGDRPWPFYAPANQNSSIVDQGVDVGLPFLGTAPDLGAYELEHESPFPVNITLLGTVLAIAIAPIMLLRRLKWMR